MKDLKLIDTYIKQMAEKHNVLVSEIHISEMTGGFISVWQFVEGGVTKEDRWKHLETNKIR